MGQEMNWRKAALKDKRKIRFVKAKTKRVFKINPSVYFINNALELRDKAIDLGIMISKTEDDVRTMDKEELGGFCQQIRVRIRDTYLARIYPVITKARLRGIEIPADLNRIPMPDLEKLYERLVQAKIIKNKKSRSR